MNALLATAPAGHSCEKWHELFFYPFSCPIACSVNRPVQFPLPRHQSPTTFQRRREIRMRRITVVLVLMLMFGVGVLAGSMNDAKAARPICWLTACTKGILWSCCSDEYGITTCVEFRCLPEDFAGINLPTGY